MLIERTEDAQISVQLHQYAEKYAAIKREAAQKLSEYGQSPKNAGAMERTCLWMGLNMNTILDKSPSHIAEMMIEGSTMGVIKGEKNKKRNQNADKSVTDLEDNLLNLEKEYIDTMKKFL